MADPVLKLLASGLQFWIRQQCESVDQLELQLHGSTLALLRGRLEGGGGIPCRVLLAFPDLFTAFHGGTLTARHPLFLLRVEFSILMSSPFSPLNGLGFSPV